MKMKFTIGSRIFESLNILTNIQKPKNKLYRHLKSIDFSFSVPFDVIDINLVENNSKVSGINNPNLDSEVNA